MELRNHPSMCFGRVGSWPPFWTNTDKNKRDHPRGEIGVLANAYTTRAVATICFLMIEHESETYIGHLMLEDPAFCQQLCSILKQNIGHTIAGIASLNVNYI